MSGHLSVGQLAKRLGISRTTLLYYESIGLLVPSARTQAGYRHYSAADTGRALQIRAYRATGMALDAIAALLDGRTGDVIEQRLDAISAEIAHLREQQAVLLKLAGGGKARRGAMTKQRWTALLRAAGMDDATMDRWHALFEHQAPQAHAAFLASLGLDGKEIARIRHWSRKLGISIGL